MVSIMKVADIGKLRRSIEKTLDAKRYEHTLGVTYTAASLAMCYDVDIRKAQIAGLMHDCAKCVEDTKKVLLCEKHNIEITEIERNNPFLLHAKVGSYIAMKKYKISDDEIIMAILSHTTGRPAMSSLEKIIYIADYIEPCRKHAPRLAEIRQLAFREIDKALLQILEDKLVYLDGLNCEIDPMTRETYEYYAKIASENTL